MPYYTGAANSMAGLLESVTAACVAEGWTWADSILSKGNVFVQLTANDSGNPSIRIQGGTGRADGALVNPSSAHPYLARVSDYSGFEDISYPCTYHLFVFDEPDEIYLVVQYGVDWHAWLAFGNSIIDGASVWIAANKPTAMYWIYDDYPIRITANGGNSATRPVAGIFWKSSSIGGYGSNYSESAIYADVWRGDNYAASNSTETQAVTASLTISQLISRGLSNWNSESVLLPIQPCYQTVGSKMQMLADLFYARYLRIDNYDPGQILTIGSEHWMVFPFIRKNTAARDGGSSIDHTGTFGWAIRYDGNN